MILTRIVFQFTSCSEMAVLWWMCFVLSPGLIHSYVDICSEGTCSATLSTIHDGLGANKVIDGDTDQYYTSCSHTATGETSASVVVDLRKVYHLKNIVIYYRIEDDWKPYRFREFELSVTSGGASQWTLCHRDTTKYPAYPSSVQNITCKNYARYVRVATRYDAPEAGREGPVLEVCEIKVYGCNVGDYGPSCLSCGGCQNCDIETGCPCSQNCVDGICDANGNCNGACSSGFWGMKCTDACRHSNCLNKVCNKGDGSCTSCIHGYYGDTCSSYCSACQGQTCDKTGYCTNGCMSGYYGNICGFQCGNCNPDTCDRHSGYCSVCDAGYYGDKCYTQCSSTCLNRSCRKSDGYCLGCEEGNFGFQCKKSCNEYCFSKSCDQMSGQCTNGCKEGYYGSFCNMTCSPNCAQTKCNTDGTCIGGCKSNWVGINCEECDLKHYGQDCSLKCSASCQNGCNKVTGNCIGTCGVRKYGNFCNKTCDQNCKQDCHRDNGYCIDCVEGKFGDTCQNTCGGGCDSNCAKNDGSCTCKVGWQETFCNECSPFYYGALCEHKCSPSCLNGTCFSNNGSCIGGCTGNYIDEKCTVSAESMQTSFPTTPVAAGAGVALILLIVIIISAILFIRLRRRKHSNSQSSAVHFNKEFAISSEKTAENKLYTNIENVPVTIEDPEEEPQIENPEEAVYYNDLSVAKDIAVSDLLKIITQREDNEMEGFQKEFKSLPYGERFPCETAKTTENMPRNRFKTTFPYDHSRVILEIGNGFTSDYINANYIENMEGKKEFIACQGPRENTLVDHWRMIWQEHVEYIVMLTNLIEGPKVKCHQYWPDEGKELDVSPFSVTLVEEKVYAYFVERKMSVRKKKVTGSRTVVQYHYTRWPDHGTPNPLNLVVFHRHFRHKIKPSQHPIIVHCSAGIGRTGTFIALDVLSRYGKDKGKVNVIEYVKAMRKDRMTMIQNVDQYVFLYHALYEFFRRKPQYKKKDKFVHQYGDFNRINTQKHLTNEFNELVSLKPRYDAHDFKSGKKFSKLNFTKSVLPVEQYLVYLTSHVPGRESYYNAVTISSFTRAEEFISAQFPVSGAAIDLVRLLIDHESAFLIAINPLSEVKELQSWVEDKHNLVKLSPYTITKGTETLLTKEIRKTTINITDKEKSSESHEIQIFECLNWSSDEALPKETSALTNLIKQFSLDRKYHQDGHLTVISKDGATCCGVFIAVYNAIEQLQQDDEVDISTIVQQLQCRRPEMISTKEEYEFCFKAISDFQNTDNVYANS